MEGDKDNGEEFFKHVCKLCNKRYPSGKSLGGHMRSHVIANSRKANKPISKNKTPTFDNDDEDEDDNGVFDHKEKGYSGYGLRENPKKTWKTVDSSLKQQEERICKQCGKGFQSLKALCGHMSSHSEKDRNFNGGDDNSWSSDSKDQLLLAMETHYDINSKRQTRSSLSRYKSAIGVDGGGYSSNNSEIDHQEQEEVAKCLMMLSRDSSGHRNYFNFATESSDNNSVILDVNLMNRKLIKQEINVNQEMDNSDSGYFENGAKKLESDDSVDGFLRNYGFKNPKVDFGSGLVDSYDDSRKRRTRDVGNFGLDSHENSSKKIKEDYSNSNNPQKGSKFECWICNKAFKTHQALGGHIISHRKDGENNFFTSSSPNKLGLSSNSIKKGSGSKKIKGHKCPYCPRVFKSGQALGGHKRSHMIGAGGFSEDKSTSPEPEFEPEPEQKPALIDLNLPAPLEEGTSGDSQFLAW